MPCVLSGTNRYSSAVFIAELVRKYFVLEVRKEKSRPSDLLKKILEYCFITQCECVYNCNGIETLCGASASIEYLYRTKL